MLDRRKFVLSALTLPSLIGSAKQAISAPVTEWFSPCVKTHQRVGIS